MSIVEIFFWLCLGGLTLFYGTYSSLMYKSAKRRPIKVHGSSVKCSEKQGFTPKVSLIIATYNEAKVIQRKLMNIQELDYPKDALEIIIIDSASTDNTVELAKAFLEIQKTLSFRILTQARREGKASALNYCRPFCSGNILVLTDADVIYDKCALTLLVTGFRDQSVGAISGKIVIYNPDESSSTKCEKSYRGIFEILRIGESNLDSTPIFNGPISAFRKELVDDLNLATVADDTELSLKIREKGWKAIYEPNALAFEKTPENFKSRNKQKIRRGQGVIQSFFWHRKMFFRPKYGFYGLVILPAEFFMHVLSPLLVVTTIVLGFLNLALTPGFIIFGFLSLILLFSFGLIKLFTRFFKHQNKFDPIDALVAFLNIQFNLVFSVFSLFLGKNRSVWEKIEDVRSSN
jgi:cellulose synthase/poly-beta-1,6-N-acetylglucosamine synthase-like glycosyltransferase